jgi:hypothetical protein
VKDHFPRARAGSVSVPDTVQCPALRRSLVLIAPAGETITPHALEVVTYLTGPRPPVVRKWLVNAAEAAVVVVADLGPRWVMVTEPMARV